MLDHVLKRSLCVAGLGLGSVLFALSCADAKPVREPESPDAGAPACLPTEGGQGGVPNDSDVPNLPDYGGGPTLEDDAGTTPIVDAATDAAAAEDTGAPPSPDLDAGDSG
jgi:hypothetical protein